MTTTKPSTAEWREAQRARGKQLRMLLVEHDVKQVDVAEVLGLAAPHLSEFLNARRQWPEGFEGRFEAAVKQVSA